MLLTVFWRNRVDRYGLY